MNPVALLKKPEEIGTQSGDDTAPKNGSVKDMTQQGMTHLHFTFE